MERLGCEMICTTTTTAAATTTTVITIGHVTVTVTIIIVVLNLWVLLLVPEKIVKRFIIAFEWYVTGNCEKKKNCLKWHCGNECI
jgi:hypothetical protein